MFLFKKINDRLDDYINLTDARFNNISNTLKNNHKSCEEYSTQTRIMLDLKEKALCKRIIELDKDVTILRADNLKLSNCLKDMVELQVEYEKSFLLHQKALEQLTKQLAVSKVKKEVKPKPKKK